MNIFYVFIITILLYFTISLTYALQVSDSIEIIVYHIIALVLSLIILAKDFTIGGF